MRHWKPDKVVLGLWLLVLFTWWLRYHPVGQATLVFDDDARQHVYWTARFQDPTLFPDDFITDFISSYRFAPWGHQALYRLATSFLDPLTFSQVLSLLLMGMSVWLLDRLMQALTCDPRGRVVAGFCFVLYHTHNTVHNVNGGFARSFALPLLLVFVLLLQQRRRRLALAVVGLDILFYPPILPNTLALAGAELITGWRQGRRLRKLATEALCLAAVTLLAGAILMTVYGNGQQDLMGPQVTLKDARGMAEFYPGGRSVFFQNNWLLYVLIGRSGVGLLHLSGFLILLALMIGVQGWRNFRVPPLAWRLLWTSLVLFALSHLLLFRLYLPSRYTFYTVSLACIVTLGVNLNAFLQGLRAAWPGLYRAYGRCTPGWRWTAVAVCAMVYAAVQSQWISRIDPRLVVLDRQDLDMLHFLARLPSQSLVAGHPRDMDNVPLVARRKVLANRELALPYYLGYYARVKKRLLDSLLAYYAGCWDDVWSVVQRYGIDVLVINKTRLRPQQANGRMYDEPFDRLLKARRGAASRRVLAQSPRALRCFENDRYVVLCLTDHRLMLDGLKRRATPQNP